MKVINTPDAPKAIGPYSQAVIANGLLFTSGQIAINPKTNQIGGNSHRRANQTSDGKPQSFIGCLKRIV